ncbi:MAG: GNAT family N-acetyltransferase [Rhodothermaceae bacterium]|nr:GNAT family N-acetyltransferase [Rhodothermaceae bacterium]
MKAQTKENRPGGPAGEIEVRIADWSDDKPDIRRIRTLVFIEEQKIPEDEEFDDADKTAVHVLAYNDLGEAIGTARLLGSKKIGRVAVVKSWRGKGVGKALIGFLMQMARENGAHTVELDAQVYAIPFYERLGYRVTGGEFMDAGIPHRKMSIEFS